VRQALRRALLKYKLHTDQELFDRAYSYIRQYLSDSLKNCAAIGVLVASKNLNFQESRSRTMALMETSADLKILRGKKIAPPYRIGAKVSDSA